MIQFFCYSFFLGGITGIKYSSAFFRIIYRWNILYLDIHMKMDCTIIKDEKIPRWYVLIKLIVIGKEGKRCILNYWIISRDEIFVFGCGQLMVVDKMGQLFCCISSPLSWASKPAPRLCPVMLIVSDFGTCFLIFLRMFFLQKGLPGVFHFSKEVSLISNLSS